MIIKSITSVFIFLLGISFFSYGQTELEDERDSLIAICYNENLNDTIRADAYSDLAIVYYKINRDSALIVFNEGILFISEAKKKVSELLLASLMGSESELYMTSGYVYYQKGKHDDAIQYFYKALEIRKILKDKRGEANALNNIGNIQLDLGETKKAEQCFNEILLLQKEIKDSVGIARTYNTLGYIERRNGNDSKALTLYQYSLELRIKLNDRRGIAVSHNNIGYIYKKQEDFLSAVKEYHKAYEIYNEIHFKDGIISVLSNFANCYLELKDYKKAKKYALEAYNLASKDSLEKKLLYLNEVLYKIHAKMGNYKSALKSYQEFIQIRDSIESKKHYKALINQEFQEKEKINELNRQKEKELSDLKHQNEIMVSNQRSTNLIIAIIFTLLGLAVVSLLLYLFYKQLKIVKSQKIIIEKQNKEIEMKALRSQMNPHFLFNSINSIKHFIIKNDTETAANYLTKFAKLIRLVLENSKHNLVSLEEELESLKYYLELEKLRFNNKFNYVIEGEVNSDFIQLPPLILQPFVENAIWHGLLHKEETEGLISIRLSETKTSIQIEIEDNGVGRKKAAEYKSQEGVKKESMGLNITHDRLKVLNKVIGIESTVQVVDLYDGNNNASGTLVILKIPYHD